MYILLWHIHCINKDKVVKLTSRKFGALNLQQDQQSVQTFQLVQIQVIALIHLDQVQHNVPGEKYKSECFTQTTLHRDNVL